jgi:hypothetical protein
MKSFALTFGGFVVGVAVVKVAVMLAKRREARKYPTDLERYAEQKVRDAGYGRDSLGRPKHTK